MTFEPEVRICKRPSCGSPVIDSRALYCCLGCRRAEEKRRYYWRTRHGIEIG